MIPDVPAAGPFGPGTLVGRILAGKFRLESCIGKSEDALVFRARQLNLQRDVAVKILLAEPSNDWQLGARLRREAQLVAALRHPGLAAIFDEGVTDDGLPFIVMEFLRGQTLKAHLESRARLATAEAVEIVVAVASVLSAVHAAGYVHRDLKPGNIFLSPNDQGGHDVKVIDFGAVRRVVPNFAGDVHASNTLRGVGQQSIIKTMPGFVIGTPYYMSPEQCRAGQVDAQSDIYALGVVLYELLTGSLPFEAATQSAIMAAHLVLPPIPFAEKGVPVPRALERAVMSALEKEPVRRPSSMDEFARRLLAGLHEPDTTPLAPPAPRGTKNVATRRTRAARGPSMHAIRASESDPPEIPTTRAPLVPALIAVGLLASAVAVALLSSRRTATKPEPLQSPTTVENAVSAAPVAASHGDAPEVTPATSVESLSGAALANSPDGRATQSKLATSTSPASGAPARAESSTHERVRSQFRISDLKRPARF